MSDYLVGFGQVPASQRLATRPTRALIPTRPLDDLGPMYTKPGQHVPPREEVYPLHEESAEQEQQPEPSLPKDKTTQYVLMGIAGLGLAVFVYFTVVKES